MASTDSRKPSLLARLMRRPVEPAPQPSAPALPPAEPDENRQRRRPRAEPGHVPTPFYTGQPMRRRVAPKVDKGRKAEFDARSGADKFREDQEFDRRFKGDVARTMARNAMDDAAIVRDQLKERHIEALREWKSDLRWLCSTGRPVPAAAAQDINQRLEDLYAKYDHDRQEVEEQLDRTLAYAASIDVKMERSRQKLIGYVRDNPGRFNRAAESGMAASTDPAVSPRPQEAEPGRPVLDHPFNAAVTQPDPAVTSSVDAFNDATTAPDAAAAWLAKFNRDGGPTPPGSGPDR